MLFIKLLLTLFMLVLIPVYWKQYGPQNFLWFSDIGLFLTVIALWLESSLLISIAVLAMLPFELAWNIDFFVELFIVPTRFGLAQYMFNYRYPLYLRGLSLFHVLLPIIWIWCLITWGYDARALGYTTVLGLVTLICTYFFTDPERNINWVFLPKANNWRWISPGGWLLLQMILFPLCVYVPIHFLLLKLFS